MLGGRAAVGAGCACQVRQSQETSCNASAIAGLAESRREEVEVERRKTCETHSEACSISGMESASEHFVVAATVPVMA